MNPSQLKIHQVIDTFPSLRQFNRSAFDYDVWQRLPKAGISTGEKWAVLFILEVWSRRPHQFLVIEAIGCWDSEHRNAFSAWCNNPVWP